MQPHNSVQRGWGRRRPSPTASTTTTRRRRTFLPSDCTSTPEGPDEDISNNPHCPHCLSADQHEKNRPIPISRHDPPSVRLNRIHGANHSCLSTMSPDACTQFQRIAPAYRTASYKHRFFTLRIRPPDSNSNANDRRTHSPSSPHLNSNPGRRVSWRPERHSHSNNSKTNTFTDLNRNAPAANYSPRFPRRSASFNLRNSHTDSHADNNVDTIPKFVVLSGEGTHFHKQPVHFLDPVSSPPIADTWDIYVTNPRQMHPPTPSHAPCQSATQQKKSHIYCRPPSLASTHLPAPRRRGNFSMRHMWRTPTPTGNKGSLTPSEELVALREALRYLDKHSKSTSTSTSYPNLIPTRTVKYGRSRSSSS